MRRGSSRRLTRSPTIFGNTGDAGMVTSSSAFFDGVLNGVDDVLIAGAATEIAGETRADLELRRRWGILEQRHRRHDHPRRAEAALQAVFLPESLLQRMERAVAAETLDGGDLRSVCLDGEDRARLRTAAVEQHRACAALTGVAPDVSAGQPELLAQE